MSAHLFYLGFSLNKTITNHQCQERLVNLISECAEESKGKENQTGESTASARNLEMREKADEVSNYFHLT